MCLEALSIISSAERKGMALFPFLLSIPSGSHCHCLPLSRNRFISVPFFVFPFSSRRLLTYKNVAPFLSFWVRNRGGPRVPVRNRRDSLNNFFSFLLLVLASLLLYFKFYFYTWLVVWLWSCLLPIHTFFSWHLFVRVCSNNGQISLGFWSVLLLFILQLLFIFFYFFFYYN